MGSEETPYEPVLLDKFSKTYMMGDVIFEEGSIGSHMYVVSRGKVNISRRN